MLHQTLYSSELSVLSVLRYPFGHAAMHKCKPSTDIKTVAAACLLLMPHQMQTVSCTIWCSAPFERWLRMSRDEWHLDDEQRWWQRQMATVHMARRQCWLAMPAKSALHFRDALHPLTLTIRQTGFVLRARNWYAACVQYVMYNIHPSRRCRTSTAKYPSCSE